MNVTFIGATHEVTGSCSYVEIGSKHYLVDYGMRQGKETFEFVDLPVKPAQLDGVFLTHAHIDHSGMLPKLYKDGFSGKVYCTEATLNLCDVMLKDSAHIQETETEWKNRKIQRSGGREIEPIYDMDDVFGVMKLFRGFHYREKIELNENVSFMFSDIGHLLGSACVELWLTENDKTVKMVFSGDVGNTNHPIICDPSPIDGCDYLVIESTYGDRLHTDNEMNDPTEELAGYIQRAFDRGGSLIIPSFAVGRTQEILYAIKGIKEKGLVKNHPHFPVYLDSPLAVEATNVFNNCDTSYFDKEMLALIRKGINPLMNDDLVFSITSEDSKMINAEEGSKVIISSSGMCDAGRIRHHLKHNLWNANNIVLFVGYQAEGSLGRVILDGKKMIKIFGDEVAVKAEILTMHGTSGHADKNGLLNWVDAMENKPKMIFVNHGEASSCEAFKDALIEEGYKAFAPYSGSQFDLISNVITAREPVKVEPETFATSRAQQVYFDLMDQVKRLQNTANGMRGKQNRDVSKLTNQIKQLLEQWKDY